MPVVNNSNDSYSADVGVEREREYHRRIAQGFLRCAMKGNKAGLETLAMAGARKVSASALHTLSGAY